MIGVLTLAAMAVSGSCSSGNEPDGVLNTARQASSPSTIDPSPSSVTTSPAPSQSTGTTGSTESILSSTVAERTETLEAFNGRTVPAAPQSADEAAESFIGIERALRVDGEDRLYYADLGHREQLVVRTLARNPSWIDDVVPMLPPDLGPILELHMRARSELAQLHTAPPLSTLPAWEIIEPEPLEQLVSYYEEAEAATGIDWQLLAAINLIETGMGRIRGLSSAGAQGPMQFLPTTWAEVSNGGDIDDPHDAIHGAARYLVQRGGLDDIEAGLFGYNNSEHYVNAVLTYAELLRLDERALRGFYNWEIYVGTDVGTLWLPVGLTVEEDATPAGYLAANPWAETLPPAR